MYYYVESSAKWSVIVKLRKKFSPKLRHGVEQLAVAEGGLDAGAPRRLSGHVQPHEGVATLWEDIQRRRILAVIDSVVICCPEYIARRARCISPQGWLTPTADGRLPQPSA